MTRKKTKEEFVEEAKKIHGDKYDYFEFIYLGCNIKGFIICLKHGIFLKTPTAHLKNKEGCKECSKENCASKLKLGLTKFIEKVMSIEKHKNTDGTHKYDYSHLEEEDYKNTTTELPIYCYKCEETFMQKPREHLAGSGCKICVIRESKIKHKCPINKTSKLCEDKNCVTCFDNSFASHVKARFWSEENKDKNNNFISPRTIFKYTHTAYKFNCDKCPHSFSSKLYHISNGQWCPYCSSSTKKLCEDENCDTCFDNSFASHIKAKFWSEENKDEKGNFIQPRTIAKCTHTKYKFKCDKCPHTFSVGLNTVLSNKRTQLECPYCSDTNCTLCNDLNCNWCFNRSFASSENAKFWSEENKDKNDNFILPRNVNKYSINKYIFNCDKCHHIHEATCNQKSTNEYNSCPYCSKTHPLLCTKECNICLKKSFASHISAKFWSKKNKDEKGNFISPRNVNRYSNNKYILNCGLCNNEYSITLGNLLSFRNWCPKCGCKNQTELIVYDFLKKNFENIIREYKFTDIKKRFDFALVEQQIIIELDGRQHFQQVSNWDSPNKQFINDKYKEKYANDMNYSIIRILQEDVYYDRYDWKEELLNNIKKIKENGKIQNIYMCKSNEYQRYSDIDYDYMTNANKIIKNFYIKYCKI